jgi:hypothetical protein
MKIKCIKDVHALKEFLNNIPDDTMCAHTYYGYDNQCNYGVHEAAFVYVGYDEEENIIMFPTDSR